MRALDVAAPRHRQHPPAGRADADHRAVARPRPRAAGHRDPDRRQSAAAVRGRAARQGAVVLFRRHPVGRRRRASTPSSASDAPDADARTRADAARPHHVGERHQGRRHQGAAERRLGAAKRPRHHLRDRRAARLDGGRGRTGGRPTTTGRRWSRSRRRSPTGSASRSAIRSRSTCSAATSRRASPTCARSHWENLGINFVLVFSPSAFAGAPHTDIATLTYPGGGTLAQEIALLKAVSDAFPAITTVRVKDAIEAVGDIVRNLVLGGARREHGGAGRRRCWCSAARSRPATAIACTTPSCSRRSARRAAG